MVTTFYAWQTPAFVKGAPVDHTWVTTYDSTANSLASIADVVTAKENYWFCWGSFHRRGSPTPPIAIATGQLSIARCLVKENADSGTDPLARGTIFRYGIDGVCHQLANQVLYATKMGGSPALVTKARGYMASHFVYGTYGLQHAAWAAKLSSCAKAGVPANPIDGDGLNMFETEDDFDAHARKVLNDDQLLAKFLALKAEVQAFAASELPGYGPPSAEALNARNQHLIDQAYILLGATNFEAIFGFNGDEYIDLVNPRVENRTRFST